MPLVSADLADALESVFAGPPATAAECAQAWADAVDDYAASVTPASASVTAAAATLAGALATAFASPSAPPAMETAFAAFGVTVGAGMAPAFTATPPAGPVGFVAQFAGPHPATHAAAAQDIAGLVDTWLKTGTATPSGGGSPVPWT